jgi:antitoxin VapB
VISRTAKLFANGGSQAVRLPADCRFDGSQVYVRRDPVTGDVVLSSRPRRSWAEFVELRGQFGAVPGDFLENRQQAVQSRDPFASPSALPIATSAP